MPSNVVFEAYPKVPIQEFIPELAFEFTEMPEDAFAHFILRAINKLARDGKVLRRSAVIEGQQCVETYLLEPEDCTELVAVLSVCRGRAGCGCAPVSLPRLTGAPCALPCGTHVWVELPNVLHVQPVHCGDVFHVAMCVAPTYDACEVDRILLTNYYDTVMHGVRSYLYAMAGKPWSSAERSTLSETRFIHGIRAAAVETMMGGQRGALRAKRPRVL